MLRRFSKNDNFVEKRRVWRSQLDQRIGPSMLATVLPAIVMCLFLVLAAPFLKSLADRFFGLKESDVDVMRIETDEDQVVVEEVLPPPNPEVAAVERYRRKLESEGFDWRTKPQLEEPETEITPPPVKIEPIEIDLPLIINPPPQKAE